MSLQDNDSNLILGTSIIRSELPDKTNDEDCSDEDCCIDSEDEDKNNQLDQDGRPQT